MVIQNSRTKVQAEGEAVSTAAPFDGARAYALKLERLERSRGLTVEDARRAIARRVRVGIGTLENIIRDRVKRIDEKIRDRLQLLFVRELKAEIERLKHDLAQAERTGGVLGAQHVREVEAYLSKARSLLNKSA